MNMPKIACRYYLVYIFLQYFLFTGKTIQVFLQLGTFMFI